MWVQLLKQSWIEGLVKGLADGMAPLLLSFAVGLFKPSSTATAPADWKQRLHMFYYGSDRRKHSREYKCMVTRMWHPQGAVDAGYIIPRKKASVSSTSAFGQIICLSESTAS